MRSHSTCTSFSMHSMHSALPTRQPPFMVRSLQLVEVRPYAEEEEEQTVDSTTGEVHHPTLLGLGLRLGFRVRVRVSVRVGVSVRVSEY